MTSTPASRPATLGQLLRQRLREMSRSPEQLAEALQVPTAYVNELITGARRPPLPGRTDVYEKMTSFLRLGRNELASYARAEREDDPPTPRAPEAGVQRQLLELCEPATARALERRRSQRGSAELAGLIGRVLAVTQGSVRRLLDDEVRLRLAAGQRGTTYVALRLDVLEFHDATADTLTVDNLAEFIQPRIARWDVDLETGVLRVALRTQEPRERGGRAPNRGRPVAAPRPEHDS